MAGRSTIYSEKIAQHIIDSLERGNTFLAAAQAAGIDQSTLHDWRAKGRAGEQPYAEFSERVKKAQAVAEDKFLRVIKNAADDGTWQAAAWWLERRRHKSYGRKDRVDTRVSHVESMSDADLARKHKALLDEANKEFSEDGEAEANKRAGGD